MGMERKNFNIIKTTRSRNGGCPADRMKDQFQRSIRYLRLSVTDRCNLRCRYCMPAEGVPARGHDEILSFEEIWRIAGVAVDMGVEKIRLTGGEPLVRRGIVDLCRGLAQLKASGLRELCLTTNGLMLDRLARPLREAGLDRINLSLDTLDPLRYSIITRGGSLDAFYRGLEAATSAGFTGIKINAVLIGGFNDDQIRPLCEWTRAQPVEIRFIELMPMGECVGWSRRRFIPCERVLEAVPELEPVGRGGVAALYRMPNGLGRVGLIRPLSDHFCPSCNRLRVTSDGFLKPCLHSAAEIGLKGLDEAGIRAAFEQALREKPERHHLSPKQASETARYMSQIGG